MPFGYSLGGGISMNQNPYAFDLSAVPSAGFSAYGVPMGTGTTTATPKGTIPGTPPATYNPAVGGIPTVPDPLESLTKALEAYTKQIGTMTGTADQINAANQAAALKQVTDLYPQFKANTAQLGADIASWAAGQVTPSTKNEMIRLMAERGIKGGFGPDSGATNAALLSLLGKTAEGLQQQALTGQNTLLAGLPKAPLADVSKLGVDANTLFKSLTDANLLASYLKAAPNPADAYNLAIGNAGLGARAGYRAAAGPWAGAPTTGGTGDSQTLALLQQLINRGAGGGGGGVAMPDVTAPTAAELGPEDAALYGGEDAWFDYLNGMPQGWTSTQLAANRPTPDEQYWEDFYFGG